MPIISQRCEGERGTSSVGGEEMHFEWIVSTPAGSDPRNEPGVPALGSSYAQAASLKLDALELSRFIRRESGLDHWVIRLLYSSDRRFSVFRPDRSLEEFKLTYGREVIEVPTFVRHERLADNDSGGTRKVDEWRLEILNPEITVMILQRSVVVPPLTFNDILAIRNEVASLHTFPAGATDPWSGDPSAVPPVPPGPFVWRCEPPTVTQLSPSEYRIEYAWTNDPGNGPFSVEVEDPGGPVDFIAPTFSRRPFHKYRVIPSRRTSADDVYPPVLSQPRIVQYNAYPPNSPRRRPNGYLNLPGGPLG
jgi:hypothetical protein